MAEGVVTVGNPCLSGGALEIFLEAMIPPMLVHVFGDAPIARALASLGAALGYDVRATTDPEAPIAKDTGAVVVASHGRGEERVLAPALGAGVPYVAPRGQPAAGCGGGGRAGRDRGGQGARAHPRRTGHRGAHPRGDRAVDLRRADRSPATRGRQAGRRCLVRVSPRPPTRCAG